MRQNKIKIGLYILAFGTLSLWVIDQFENKIPEEIRGAKNLEKAAIDTVVKLVVQNLDELYKGKKSTVQRDAHAKSHGCLKAIFKVASDIPPDLKVGMFSEPGKEYKAWVRFSNGAFKPRPDIKFDGRGLSLKILNTSPETTASENKKVDQFDILMVNYPVFFSSDPVDYLDFVKAGVLFGKPGAVEKYFTPNYNPFSWRLRQLWIAYWNGAGKIDTPLNMRYFSMAPFSYGKNRSVKYSAQPCKGGNIKSNVDVDKSDPNFLRKILIEQVNSKKSCFQLSVQLNDGTMPLEDATREWSEKKSPYQRIGNIEIAKQNIARPHRDHFCEHTDFHPNRTPDEFKALGGINRMRERVYTAISNFRHKRNATEVPDPNLLWDQD